MIPVDRQEAWAAAKAASTQPVDFDLVAGNVRNASISIVFINCLPKAFREWRQKLADLSTAFPHLSVHIVPNVFNVRFVVRGPMVNRRWVTDHLISDAKPAECAIAVFDCLPARLYSIAARNGDPSPFRVIRHPTGQTAESLLIGGAEPRRMMTGNTNIFFLLFRVGGATSEDRVRDLALGLANPPLRDAFYVDGAHPTAQVNRQGQPLDPFGHLFSPETKAWFKQTTMIGVVSMNGYDAPTAYLKLSEEWRPAFDENTPADVEILPAFSGTEVVEYVDDPHTNWRERLNEKNVQGERVSIGWLRSSVSRTPNGPRFDVEQMTSVVIGPSGSGKSVIAYHLLAEYARANFNVVFLNCKKAGKTGTGPANTGELVDFSAVMWGNGAKPVIAAPLDKLSKHVQADRGTAYYTEIAMPDDDTVEHCQALKDALGGEKFVLCFDEIVNRDLDGDVSQKMKDFLQSIVGQGREPGYSVILVHQYLVHLFKQIPATWAAAEGTWPGLPGEATFFLRRLAKADQPIYNAMCDGKSDYFETNPADIAFEKFAQAPHGEVVVVQPYRQSTEKPIPLELPAYTLPDPEFRKSFKDRLPWGEVSYPALK